MQDSLARLVRPTLLILDTYEAAGEATDWVEQRLLLALGKSSWLRVVILGQRLPDNNDAPWYSVVGPSIALEPPSLDDWYEFGREHRPDADWLTREWVLATHAAAGGKATLLAQLLKPRS